jgi:hypothetical protein
MKRPGYILFAAFVLLFASLACNAVLPQMQTTSVPTLLPIATLVPSQIPEAVSTQPPATSENLPQTDAEVPRVHPNQAKLAFDRGDAIIVDVRGPEAYAERHITGALEISLTVIETDPTSLNLDKNKWIITYCT